MGFIDLQMEDLHLVTLSGINMTDIEFHPTNNNVIYGASKEILQFINQ